MLSHSMLGTLLNFLKYFSSNKQAEANVWVHFKDKMICSIPTINPTLKFMKHGSM